MVSQRRVYNVLGSRIQRCRLTAGRGCTAESRASMLYQAQVHKVRKVRWTTRPLRIPRCDCRALEVETSFLIQSMLPLPTWHHSYVLCPRRSLICLIIFQLAFSWDSISYGLVTFRRCMHIYFCRCNSTTYRSGCLKLTFHALKWRGDAYAAIFRKSGS